MRKNNGITLISLVITIIIMLILVGVSINLAVNGGLFEYVGNAVGDTKNAMKNEQDLIGDIIENYIKPNIKKDEEGGDEGTKPGEDGEGETPETSKPAAPTLSVTSGTEGNNGWYTTDVTVTITPQSETDQIKYSISGAQTQNETVGTSMTITAEGTSTITGYACNNLGEKSEPVTIIIKKDSIAPQYNINKEWDWETLTVSWNIIENQDNGSKLFYSVEVRAPHYRGDFKFSL